MLRGVGAQAVKEKEGFLKGRAQGGVGHVPTLPQALVPRGGTGVGSRLCLRTLAPHPRPKPFLGLISLTQILATVWA